MEFRLYYRGELKANRGPSDKQALRKQFHPQLRELFLQQPLNNARHLLDTSYTGTHILFDLGGFRFAPLITSRLQAIAKLDILFMRPEEPGAVIAQGGDIDNRLKTLFDGLRMPHAPNELPSGAAPEPNEHPFFCLLEDDNLITELTVRTDRLLQPVASKSEVVLVIHVKTGITSLNRANGVLA